MSAGTRIAYFDCFASPSGALVLGALVDAGLALDELRQGSLPLGGGPVKTNQGRLSLAAPATVYS